MPNEGFMEVGVGYLFGSLLGINGHLLTHGGKDNDVSILLLLLEELVNLLTNLSIRNLDVILGLAIIGHQGKESIVRDIKELVLATSDVGNIHVVGGGAEFFKLLASEDIDGNKMDLGVAVLAGLGGGHVDDLAGAALDDNETVLPQGRALHRVGGRGTSIGALEGVLMLGIVVRHLDYWCEEVRMRKLKRARGDATIVRRWN